MCKCVQDIYKTDEFEELLESARMNAANDWEESLDEASHKFLNAYCRQCYDVGCPACDEMEIE